ncbi:MAG: glycosyltransferase, partial [Candidatus Auribacterota bacterium]|nr:glycosyltransferase [Candidatus Auribacterota bacterium]
AGDCLLAEHRSYYDNLKKQAEEYRLGNLVKFTGPVLHSEMPMLYKSSDVFINLSDTDSLDKAVLEAMSCGLPVLTSNKSFREVFSSDLKSFFVEKNNPDELVAKIEMLAGKTAEQQTALGVQLRAIVVNNHNLKNCIEKIYKEINGIVVQGNV